MDRIYKYLVEQIRRLIKMGAYGFKDDKSKSNIPKMIYQQSYEANTTYKTILDDLATWMQNQSTQTPIYSMFTDYSKVYEIVLTVASVRTNPVGNAFKRIFKQGSATEQYTVIGNFRKIQFYSCDFGNNMNNPLDGYVYGISIAPMLGHIYLHQIVNGTITSTDVTDNTLSASSAQPVTITLYAYDY